MIINYFCRCWRNSGIFDFMMDVFRDLARAALGYKVEPTEVVISDWLICLLS